MTRLTAGMRVLLPVAVALALAVAPVQGANMSAPPSQMADLSAARAAMQGPSSGWPQALVTFQAAARNGDPSAAYRLGLMVRNGMGTPADSAVAAHWFLRAAEGGVPAAMFVYANMLIAGEGVTADPGAARHWLERAADREHPGAMQQLAMLLRDGAPGFPADPERANILLKESAHALRHPSATP